MIHLLFFFKFLVKFFIKFFINPLLLINKYIAKTDKSLIIIIKKLNFLVLNFYQILIKLSIEMLKLKKIKLKILIDLNFDYPVKYVNVTKKIVIIDPQNK